MTRNIVDHFVRPRFQADFVRNASHKNWCFTKEEKNSVWIICIRTLQFFYMEDIEFFNRDVKSKRWHWLDNKHDILKKPELRCITLMARLAPLFKQRVKLFQFQMMILKSKYIPILLITINLGHRQITINDGQTTIEMMDTSHICNFRKPKIVIGWT